MPSGSDETQTSIKSKTWGSANKVMLLMSSLLSFFWSCTSSATYLGLYPGNLDEPLIPNCGVKGVIWGGAGKTNQPLLCPRTSHNEATRKLCSRAFSPCASGDATNRLHRKVPLVRRGQCHVRYWKWCDRCFERTVHRFNSTLIGVVLVPAAASEPLSEAQNPCQLGSGNKTILTLPS